MGDTKGLRIGKLTLKCRRGINLLNFFVNRMLVAVGAELFEF